MVGTEGGKGMTHVQQLQVTDPKQLRILETMFQMPMKDAVVYGRCPGAGYGDITPLPPPLHDWIAKYVQKDQRVSFAGLVRQRLASPFAASFNPDPETSLDAVRNSILLRNFPAVVSHILNAVTARRSLRMARMYMFDRMQPMLEGEAVNKQHMLHKWRQWCRQGGVGEQTEDLLLGLLMFFALWTADGGDPVVEAVADVESSVLLQPNAHLVEPDENALQKICAMPAQPDDMAFCVAVSLQQRLREEGRVVEHDDRDIDFTEDLRRLAAAVLSDKQPTLNSLYTDAPLPSLRTFTEHWESTMSLLHDGAFQHMQVMGEVLVFGKITVTTFEPDKPLIVLRHSSEFTRVANILEQTCRNRGYMPFSLTANRIKLGALGRRSDRDTVLTSLDGTYAPVVVAVHFYRWNRGATVQCGFYIGLQDVIRPNGERL